MGSPRCVYACVLSAFEPIDPISAKHGMKEMLLEATSLLYFLFSTTAIKTLLARELVDLEGPPEPFNIKS
jgi:hypothetical protein